MLALYGRAAEGWDFLVGDEANIDAVAKAVGFKYRYDARQDQYAHPAVLMLTKPNGRPGSLPYGLEFAPATCASVCSRPPQGRSISTIEKVILYCYMYDPIGAKYVLVARNVMKLAGVITVFLLGGFLLIMWRREARCAPLRSSSSDDRAARRPRQPRRLDSSKGTSRARA